MSREYFVSPNGDDNGAGTLASPWQSLAKLNATLFVPGDRIYLEGGQCHKGSLLFTHSSGSADKPIVVSSYGSGRARIESGNEGGILIWNTGGFHILHIEIVGAGYPQNNTHGICLFADKGGFAHWESVVIDDIDVSGFGCAGIAIGSKGLNGFGNVRIKNVHAHHNAYAGIFSWGDGQEYVHHNITLRDCITESNAGIPGLIHPSGHGIHSGHGILLSCVDSALVENCVSHDNGNLNTAHNCGPAGIWASNSRRMVFRRNKSFRNKTAAATDGGGFGFDGGVNESVMEENFSHDNDGPGFLFAQYYGAKPFRSNRLIGNVSENDGRSNDNGAIHIWGPADDLLQDLLIQNNTVRLSDPCLGRPRALFIDARTKNLKILNNNLHGLSSSIFLEVSPLQRNLIMQGNILHAAASAILWRGRHYTELCEWLRHNPQGNLSESLAG